MTHKLFGGSLFALLLLASAVAAPAQTSRTTPAPQVQPTRTPAPQEAGRTSADETFELDIAERRITQANFEASTSVEFGGEEEARGVNLRVGVWLGASNIDVLLRNVRGRVRFRGSLESVLQRIGLSRRPASGATTETPPSPPADSSP